MKALIHTLLTAAVLSATGASAVTATIAHSQTIVVEPPSQLPVLAGNAGEATYRYHTGDGSALLYIETQGGHELSALDVTDPAKITALTKTELATIIGPVAGSVAFAQDDGSPHWLERASITRARQPDWVTPLITASANLEEAVIYDISRKIPTNGIPLVTAGSNRGIQFVPFGAFQITFATTPYEFHNNVRAKNGFGDSQFGFKYRLASSNIEHKDFAISIATGVSVPTGSYQNGQHSGTLTPTLLGEKGWGAVRCAKHNRDSDPRERHPSYRSAIYLQHRLSVSAGQKTVARARSEHDGLQGRAFRR